MHRLHNDRAPLYLADSITTIAEISADAYDLGLPVVSAMTNQELGSS